MDWRKKYVTLMTIAISMARVAMGYQLAILGQNLLYFTWNMNVSVSTLSICFMAGAIGVIAGGFAAAGLKKKYPRRQFYVMGLAAGVFGLIASATPWIRTYWIFLFGYVMGGIAYGILETGLTALILELLGEKESRIHIQLYHLNYGIGAFIGPLIAGALIQSGKDGLEKEMKGCKLNISHDASSDSSQNLTGHGSTDLYSANASDYNGNAWSYHIETFWMVTPTVIMIYLAFKNIEEKMLDRAVVTGSSGTKGKRNADEPLRSVVWILLAVTGYYTAIVASDSVVHYYIYSVAICSEMSFTMTNAVLLNALTWLGSGVGRVIATLVATRMRPLFMILCGIAVSCFSCMIMSIFGQSHTWISWAWACLYGLSVSILYPAGVCWLSRKVCVTGIYMFVFTLGGSLGGLCALPIAGAVFDTDIFSVMHVITGLCFLTGVFFLLSMYTVSGRKDLVDDQLQEKDDIEKDPIEIVNLRQHTPINDKK